MAVSLWLLVVFVVVLLALPVAIVIAAWARRTSRAEFPRSSPPRTDNPPAEGADAEPDLPEPATGRPRPRCRAALRASPGSPTRPVTRPILQA